MDAGSSAGAPVQRDPGRPRKPRRLGPYAGSLSIEPRTLRWEFASFAEMAELFQRSGPRPLEGIAEDRQADLMREAQEVVGRHNEAADGAVAIDAEYSLVVARRRG